jgi:hypothetical protein
VILEGEVVAFDPTSGELPPFQDVMFRRRKYGINEAVRDFPASLFCFELLYADGTDLTRLRYLERRARLTEAITPAARLQLTTAEQAGDEQALVTGRLLPQPDGFEGRTGVRQASVSEPVNVQLLHHGNCWRGNGGFRHRISIRKAATRDGYVGCKAIGEVEDSMLE